MATLVVPKWYHTRLDPVWQRYRELPYRNEPFNDPDTERLWRQQGFTQSRFTGDMYDMRGPTPAWMPVVQDCFDWQYFSWSVYRMSPGTVLPDHSDTYAKFRSLHGINDIETVWRAVIFLEPWASGHYFEIDATPVTAWRAGDAVVWQGGTRHLAANLGTTNRYTLQITGIPQ